MYHAAIAATAATLTVLAPSASAAPSGHFSFVLMQFTPTGYVDNPPKGGPNHPTPGDILTAHSTIYDKTGKHRIGRTSETCTVTVASPLTMDCSFALLFFYGSELLVHSAFDPTHTPWRAVVVGGYGKYAGAHGWVRETSLPKGERMTGVLTS